MSGSDGDHVHQARARRDDESVSAPARHLPGIDPSIDFSCACGADAICWPNSLGGVLANVGAGDGCRGKGHCDACCSHDLDDLDLASSCWRTPHWHEIQGIWVYAEPVPSPYGMTNKGGPLDRWRSSAHVSGDHPNELRHDGGYSLHLFAYGRTRADAAHAALVKRDAHVEVHGTGGAHRQPAERTMTPWSEAEVIETV